VEFKSAEGNRSRQKSDKKEHCCSAAVVEAGSRSLTLGAGQFMHSRGGGLYTLVQATLRPTRWLAVAVGLLHRTPPVEPERATSNHTSPAQQCVPPVCGLGLGLFPWGCCTARRPWSRSAPRPTTRRPRSSACPPSVG
jgi:hypothetical protein